MSAKRGTVPGKIVPSGAELVASQCAYCRHDDEGDRTTCTAYPGGIPRDILDNLADHRLPQPGDRGIHFAPRPDVPDAVLARLGEALDRLDAPEDDQ